MSYILERIDEDCSSSMQKPAVASLQLRMLMYLMIEYRNMDSQDKSRSVLMPNFPSFLTLLSWYMSRLDSKLSQEGTCQTGRQPLNTHTERNNIETHPLEQHLFLFYLPKACFHSKAFLNMLSITKCFEFILVSRNMLPYMAREHCLYRVYMRKNDVSLSARMMNAHSLWHKMTQTGRFLRRLLWGHVLIAF